MGTISSGTGLVSGLDIQSIVTQLIAIESRPLELIQSRIEQTQQEQTAYVELNARVLAIKAAMSSLARPSSFTNKTATSSAPEVLSATATSASPLDTYSFQVASLVTTHQLVSSGFVDRDVTPVGAGTLTFEVGKGSVSPATPLSALNNFQGVRRGSIRITDQNGDSAVIDFGHALTVNDVLDAINAEIGIAVTARVSGDGIVIEDQSGGSATQLRVQDIGGGYTATDLGIVGMDGSDGAVDGVINGKTVVALTESTRLANLNDDMGVRVDGGLDDLRFTLKDGRQIDVNLSSRLQFITKLDALNDGRGVREEDGQRIIRITDRTGTSAEVDLSAAETIQDVHDAIVASGLSVGLALSSSKIIVTDDSEATASNLIIEDVKGYAAVDLGIEADTDSATIGGKKIYNVDTLGDVLRAIKYAEGNIDAAYPDGVLTATVSEHGVVITDHSAGGGGSGGAGVTTVEALNDSKAIYDLGLVNGYSGTTVASFAGDTLTSRDLIAGLNTVLLSSLRGGSGIETGQAQFTLRDGTVTGPVDFTGARTLQDVIETINAVDGLSAVVSAGGSGLIVTDTTGGTGTLEATDLTGSTVAGLGLTSKAADQLASDDLQLRYIAENTSIADLNGGDGITFGNIQITNSNGETRTITLTQDFHETIGDVIDAINKLDMGVTARINDDGDGIALEDTAGGTGTLAVVEMSGGTTAADLGILGTAQGNVLEGSFARTIEIDADDTLDDLIEKINSAGVGATASLINDGTAYAPYRLILTSETSGTQGKMTYNIDGTGVSLATLTEAQDAAVIFGSPDSPNAIVVTSNSNTITDVAPGLTLNLLGTSTQPVQVTVDNDVESVINSANSFVTSFNEVMDRIDEYTQYIPETEARGVLLGDGGVLRIRSQLYREVTRTINDPELNFKRLSELGITVESGARLQLDEEKLRAAFEQDPEGVRRYFTKVDIDEEDKPVNVGFAARFDEVLNGLTNGQTGTIAQESDRLQSRVDLYNQRVEHLADLLAKKEARLYAQFQAMESALADMQSQQSSLSVLANLASSYATGTTVSA